MYIYIYLFRYDHLRLYPSKTRLTSARNRYVDHQNRESESVHSQKPLPQITLSPHTAIIWRFWFLGQLDSFSIELNCFFYFLR